MKCRLNLVLKFLGGPRRSGVGFIPFAKNRQGFVFAKPRIAELTSRSKRRVMTTLARYRMNFMDIGDGFSYGNCCGVEGLFVFLVSRFQPGGIEDRKCFVILASSPNIACS